MNNKVNLKIKSLEMNIEAYLTLITKQKIYMLSHQTITNGIDKECN
jgi:hypothetical protein